MDASTLVDLLLENQQLISFLATGPDGQPAIYQIIAPEANVFPRLAVFEDSREYTEFADDEPIEEVVRFRIDIFTAENTLNEISSALHRVLREHRFARVNPLPDDYLPDADVFVKSAVYEVYEQL